jgi:hypothetical protein
MTIASADVILPLRQIRVSVGPYHILGAAAGEKCSQWNFDILRYPTRR